MKQSLAMTIRDLFFPTSYVKPHMYTEKKNRSVALMAGLFKFRFKCTSEYEVKQDATLKIK